MSAIPAVMDQVVLDALAAIKDEDWGRVRPLLHPYLRWTGPEGQTVRGRARVLGQLARTPPSGLPVRCELRDGQIYRWAEAG